MDPDFKTAQKPNMQGVYGPTPDAGVQPPNFQPVKPLKRSKKPLITLASIVVIVIITGIVAMVLSRDNQPKQATQTEDTDQKTTDAQGPQPATAVSTEQANNAISQEIGNLNDDNDFPADQLSDDNIDL